MTGDREREPGPRGPDASGGAPDEAGGAGATSAARIALLYLLFGTAWILFSDALLPRLVADPEIWQTVKGLVFVILSAGLIYGLVHWTLAARHDSEARRRAVERRYRAIFQESVAGAFRTTLDGEILECNQALAELLGYDRPRELVGTNARSHYVDPADRADWTGDAREGEAIRNREIRLRRRDGRDAWVLLNAAPVNEPGRSEPVLAGTMVDLTREKRLRDELEAYAYHDSLTGLPNRRYLRDEAESVLSRARRNGDMVAMLYVDLNRFGRINETLGHGAGDDVLFQVGRRLDRELRAEDLAARIGGDEFAVLLNSVDEEEGAVAASARIQEVLAAPFEIADRTLHVGASIGVALFPDHATTFDTLLSRADQAMLAPDGDSSDVRIYRPSPGASARDELAEEADLREALEGGQLDLRFQPVVRIADEAVTGAEALVRWDHPRLGLRRPASFIPVAERSGLISRIDLWVLEQVLRTANRLPADEGPEWFSVNVSARSLEDRRTVRVMQELIDRYRPEPNGDGERGDRGVVIEVTETAAMKDPRRSEEVLGALRTRGIRVAIDDFGTGHSALAYLKTLPVDLIKLDMIFVRGIEGPGREDRLLRALVNLGRTLEVEVIAEGVETEKQLRRLAFHDCDLVQGYYLGRPARLEEFPGLRSPD